ncbi:uncharacterized protein FTJAE_13380 [Fusarium tjaetaba]|uniref:Vault poly n=1 Tax=Fusarium tjaetaba TaxID=1567544 RepID=A0A8H5VAZ5_9HYPO|nr:uncharacterized protein FTJAE_13380 [Fusarium tjaetaba]KAF5615395.1 hypothetical protein FTJAE_13380 [Fusarium tjaetaba]
MASRHVFTQRLKSGVIFSAPGNLMAMPEGGWGDDTPITRPKKPKRKFQGRGLDHFSHWVAKVTLGDEPNDNVDSIMPGNDTRGIGNEYRPYSLSPYPEIEVETAVPKIPEVTLCLPMLSVSLTATVDGTVAHTELLQKFHNPSDVTIDAAKHVFPLYDGAVIISFECTIGDERRVRGVVKPKVQARKEFEEAVRDKVAAPALLEEHTPEIFETSLGNIPANTTVEIKITYVQELKVVMMESEATEGIALTIPMSIAPRYSKAPIEWEPASRVPEERLDIWIKVLDNGKVNHEGCDEESGHLLQFEGSKPAEYSTQSERDAAPRTYYVWHHVSEPAVLRKDFVFVIQMNEGHQIKSRAIACPADDNGLAAMMVNIRPNDLFRNAIMPQSFTGEILFLLDQSGSMGWTNGSPDYVRRHTVARKIDVMREAMLLALSGIPSTCVFNVISWGSATMGLWETSRPHTKENIREAKSYVSQVEADMGGTDLLRALESTLKRRVQDRGSTQIIILTDGELEPEDSIQFIWKKRQLFGDSIRFFALGIGDEVSHRLVESIAECGGGYSDVVHTTQTPRWHDRLNRLLKSALEPNSWSCDIDLGSGFKRKSLVDYNIGHGHPADGDKAPYIQAPFPISSLHPFSFASISFLIDLRHGGQLPKTVTISTTTPNAKKKTYELPIEPASGNDRTIHRLVAKSVLLDLQDQIKRGATETEVAKANAENIGMTYSITSKWTSFVAISENHPTQTVEEQKMNHYKALLDEIDIDELLNNVSGGETSSYGSTAGSSSNIAYGASQSPRMKSTVGTPTSQYHMMPEMSILEYARSIPPAGTSPVPVPMPKPCPPARSPAIVSLPPYSMGGSRDERSDLRQCSLEDDDEPEALYPLMSQQMSDPKQEEPQGSVDRITGRSLRISDRSNEVPGRSPYEDLDSSGSLAQEASDVRIPTRERVQNSSPDSIYADFPLYPNDSDWQQASRLDRTRADTTDDSQSDLPPPIEEFTQSREASAGATIPPGYDSPDHAVSASQVLPINTRHPYGTRSRNRTGTSRINYAEDRDIDGDVYDYYHDKKDPPPLKPNSPTPQPIISSRRLSVTFNQPRRDVKTIVVGGPMSSPRHDRGSAIPATFHEPEEPQVSDDGFKSRLRGRFDRSPSTTMPSDSLEFVSGSTSERTKMDERTSEPPNTSDLPSSMSKGSSVQELSDPLLPGTHSGICPSTVSKVREYSSYNWAMPESDDESAASGPQYPTYRAHPISRPWSYQHPGSRSPNSDVEGEEATNGFQYTAGGYPSDWDDGSEGNSISLHTSEPFSYSPNRYGPLDWQFAMECQDGQGLFDLDEERPSLHLHFCPETVTKFGPKISELLSNSSTPKEERGDVSARILDTLMMVECYKTHRAQEEDTWDLMMERAWDAVTSVLGLSDKEETLEELAGQLRGAMMHAHYVAATGVKDSEKDDSSVEAVRCPACHVVWRTTRQFFCPFDDESGDHADEFSRWGDFWSHQVHKGHVVCPREVIDQW